MPLIKLHKKPSARSASNKKEESKILDITMRFFNLPKEHVVIFNANDLWGGNGKEFIIEIELKSRAKDKIDEYIELLQNALPHADAISVKMFAEENVFFRSIGEN